MKYKKIKHFCKGSEKYAIMSLENFKGVFFFMKKILFALVMTMMFSGLAFAGFEGTSNYPAAQGFQSSSGNGSAVGGVVDIKDVMNMYDEQTVTVRGNIVRQLSDDKYLFKDRTGELVVEIDYKYWNGLQVSEKDVLELTGEIDKDYNSVKLDVFMVKKAK